MKMTKRFISLLLVIQMIIVCSLIPGVTALDTTETTQIVIETTEELLPMMARGCGNNYNLPDDFLNGGNWTDNYNYVSSHLQQYHGVSSVTISNNLHIIKSFYDLAANYNCIFDLTGGVYNQNGEYLGSLITGV